MADSITPARRVALTVLTAVQSAPTRRGADEHLEAVLATNPLSPADRRLAHALVYGVLRWRRTLDAALAAHATKGLPDDAWVLSVLRMAAFQLLYLDRVPQAAAVNTAVEAVRQGGRAGMAGFTNAVLRKVAAERGPGPEAPAPDAGVAAWAAFTSFPDWMARTFAEAVGAGYTAELCAANEPAPLVLRAAPGGADALRAEVAEYAGDNARVEPGRWAADAVVVAGGIGDVAALPAFAEGRCTVQDEAAQLITQLLAPQPGQRVLDVAAAPGGKAIHAAQRVGGDGEVVAVDVDPRRLERTAQAAERMHVTLTLVEGDATDALPERVEPGSFDAVLVDAPCSGLGIIRRKPDIKWARKPDDLVRMAVRQLEMLEAASAYVKPGGVLLYSVCTVSREETVEVARMFSAPAFERTPAWDAAPELSGFAFGEIEEIDFLSLPGAHGIDGFYAARWRRQA